MNKSTMTFAMIITMAAVFTLAAPVDIAMAETSNALPDGEGGEDGEHKEGKVCPVTGKTLQFQEQFS